jgi:hypothetical protein
MGHCENGKRKLKVSTLHLSPHSHDNSVALFFGANKDGLFSTRNTGIFSDVVTILLQLRDGSSMVALGIAYVYINLIWNKVLW